MVYLKTLEIQMAFMGTNPISSPYDCYMVFLSILYISYIGLLPHFLQYFYFYKQRIFKQGHLDVELNDAGRQQAAAVSYHL